MNRTVIIVQARMTSSRLPGKVLKEAGGKALLQHELEQLARVRLADERVVATTDLASDDPVVTLCQKLGIRFFRGSETDVLSRYAGAARQFEATVVVRCTADCPLIDPEVVDQIIERYRSTGADYVSNSQDRTFPRGLDAEIFSAKALFEADREAKDPYEREHVTPFIYRRPDRFRIEQLTRSPSLGHHRWTVDTPEDYELARRLLEELSPGFGLGDVLEILERRPEWSGLNRHITQKA